MTDEPTPIQPIQERRKNPPDRRTHCGRFAIFSGPGRLQVILNPELVFLTRCPAHLKDTYERLRGELDTFMVDMAQEVAKRDGFEATTRSTNLSDGRRRIYGQKID